MDFLNPHFFTPSISQQATNTNSADKSVSSVSFVLQKPRKLANVWRDETLELAEICSQRATRHWSGRKFVPRARQDTGTGGNSFSANDGTLELAEILPQRATRHWSERKFVHRKRRDAGADGNLFPALDKALEPTEICCQHAMEYWNWWKTSASFTK